MGSPPLLTAGGQSVTQAEAPQGKRPKGTGSARPTSAPKGRVTTTKLADQPMRAGATPRGRSSSRHRSSSASGLRDVKPGSFHLSVSMGRHTKDQVKEEVAEQRNKNLTFK